MIEVFVFILGTVAFSFGGVCIARIPKGESVVYGHSKCDCCGSVIKWYDLVPVLSYLFLKGKCRNCGSKVPVYCCGDNWWYS
ncbi:MAG: prepilin peptidase [Erysipelotrichaceae bacterium]